MQLQQKLPGLVTLEGGLEQQQACEPACPQSVDLGRAWGATSHQGVPALAPHCHFLLTLTLEAAVTAQETDKLENSRLAAPAPLLQVSGEERFVSVSKT